MDEIAKDDRFKDILKDQRFKILPKNERKVKIDKRFKNMFHDKKFKLKYTVDKRGRPTNVTTNDNLKKYYQLSSSEDDDDQDEDVDEENKKEATKKNDLKTKEETVKKEDEESSEDETESKEESEESEDDDDSSDDQSSVHEEEEIEIPWNELDKDTVREDKVSSRLAVCNMDWDRIKAVDLYVLFSSFKPAQGVIKSIKVYVSEYGKERIEYEKLHGPKELTEEERRKNAAEEDEDDDEDEEQDEEGNEFDKRKLRIYQFNRLRYYYAIIECDTVATAEKIYAECDGMEYESSSNRVDLRFVPDETAFDAGDVRDACTDAPDPLTYKPNLYLSTALTQTRVECTWDETPRDRLALTMRKYTEDDLKSSDFKGLLATSSESEEEQDNDEEEKKDLEDEHNSDLEKSETEEERIRRYRELLLGANAAKKSSKHREADLEFDWDGGIKEDGFNELFFNDDKKSGKNKKNFKKRAVVDEKKELTEEERKEQAQLSLLTMDEEDNKAHFNLDDLLVDKKGRKTRKSRPREDDEKKLQQDDFKLNVNDPRFQAIFNDHQFNIDPSDQSFKKTKAMENLLDEKIKRMDSSVKFNAADESERKSTTLVGAEESLLVKSIKSKTEVLKRKREENEQKLLNTKTKRF